VHLSAVNRVPQIVLTYWAIKIAATTLGETGADLLSMTLNLGYASVSLIFIGLFVLLLVPKLLIKRYDSVLYWLVFTATSLAGTAVGDFLSDDLGFGFAGGVGVISALLLITTLLYYRTKTSRVLLFWVAFVLTRPFGATFGDFLTKSMEQGGMNLGTVGSSLLFGAIVVFLVLKEHSALRTARKQRTMEAENVPAE
jgi:uncharacterized membrane-anchored protein